MFFALSQASSVQVFHQFFSPDNCSQAWDVLLLADLLQTTAEGNTYQLYTE